MSRGQSTFRQRDMAAAIKAARQGGVEVARVEVDKDGKIVVIAGKPDGTKPDDQQAGGAAEWIEK